MNKISEKVMHVVFLVSALASIVAVALICLFLLVNGVPAIGKIGIFHFLGGTKWAPTDSPAQYGIFPMILGSLYITHPITGFLHRRNNRQ